MGLRADIYRSPRGRFANGGISDRYDEVTIVNVDGPDEPSESAPAVELTVRKVMSYTIITANAVEQPAGTLGPMMGGAYIATSDSRFADTIQELSGRRFYGAVALHDRFESQAEYDALST